MNKTLIKKIENERGAALIYVLLAFVVLTIIIYTMSMIFSANLKQAKFQENRIEAYYVAQAGIEVAIASLMSKNATGVPFKDEIAQYVTLNGFGYQQGPKDLILPNGKATVTITAPRLNTAGNVEIHIVSVGSLTNSSATYTLNLSLDATNPEIQNWN